MAAGVGVAVAAAVAKPSPARRTCQRLADLCGEDIDVAACVDDFDGATDAELQDVEACVQPADNCVELTMCLAGSVMRDAVDGFWRGFSKTR